MENRRRYTGALADINVTPLVDVVLVLLIVFMIAAPVMLQGMHTNLPKAMISDLELDGNELVVTLTLEKRLYIDNDQVEAANFIATLERAAADRETESVYLRADLDLRYGEVVNIVAMIKETRLVYLGLITEFGEDN